ncbi:methylated-DNA--[protein]-cysteine S-methyltransferase [Leucobacter weissii]|uniref:methylated-DNA--[protein]-cysteine S-methyltransferase n=1 Tax=Leucobacter weissii TaxID=1983706 RepID=A0A939MPR5_9MICO|nr:methylated-DNA--[protein]-cysteine S-methyltransferase [Leucobacter weissii]MBO1900799.1 methylated-DNA--[protein]-cysteine S-methyltransferase [Leucobacter weissii]
MTRAPLVRTSTTIAGAVFQTLVTPEDGVIRAAGFVSADRGHTEHAQADPERRLAQLDPALAARGVTEESTEAAVRAVADALHAYAAGELDAIDALPVAQPETPFRGEVWKALRRVPAGGTVSYTELAALSGRPSAVRAAASACANNLVPLIVPCHRIVRTDGGLGGYLFGTELKRRLLAHEGVRGVSGTALR